MRKLGIATLVLLAAALVGADALAQRGRSSSSSSRGSSVSSQSRSSSGVSRSRSSGSSRASQSRSSSRSSTSRGSSSSRSSGYSSRSSSSRSSGYGSRASSGTSRSSGYRSSRSSSSRLGTDTTYRSRGTSSATRSSSSSPDVDRGPSLDSTRYGSRFDDAAETRTPSRTPIPGAVDIDQARSQRVRFPSRYRYGSAASRASSSARASSRASSDLDGLVDRYRDATRRAYTPSERASVAPVVDRYGRRDRDARAASSAATRSVDRYTRGPALRRTPAGSSGLERAAKRGRSASATSSPASGAKARYRAATPTERARGLTRLAQEDPQLAKRIANAGGLLADATTRAIAAGVGATSGPVAGALVRSAYARSDKGFKADLYLGYGFYPWWGGGYGDDCGWWFGFGYGSWSPWCGYGWSPYWSCGWYPYWCYSYYYAYPYYCKPSYYYPFYYSTVVHHVYDDGYYAGGDDVVVIVEDDDDVVYVDEPVGEAVAQDAAVDAPLELSLSIAAERYLTLGDRAFREGRYRDAAQFYAKAVEYAPEEGVLHLVLADALFATGDYHYAAYAIRRALELDPALADAVVDKHEFYADPAEFDRHLAEAELYVADNPADDDARLVLAANYLFGNRPAAAVDLLETLSASNLHSDPAAAAILASARAIQYGAPAEAR